MASSISEIIKKIETFVEGFHSSSNKECCKLAKYLVVDEEKLKWFGFLEDLKLFTESSLCLDGKWSSPGGDDKKFTLKSVEPDEQQLGFVLYCKKQKTIVFQGDVVSIESVKSKLLLIANKQLNRNIASNFENEQSLDKVDLQTHNSESSCEESLMVSCDGSGRGEHDLNIASIVSEKSRIKGSLSSKKGLLTCSKCACSCGRGEIIAEIEGIKLELVILKLQSCAFTTNQFDSLQSNIDLLKSAQKSLQNYIKIQGETINSFQQKIIAFESKLFSLEQLLYNDNRKLNASLDHDSQLQCTTELIPKGSGNAVPKSNCEIPSPTHLNNNQCMNILKDNSIVYPPGKPYELPPSDQLKENQSYKNCKTICISPEISPNVTSAIPDLRLSEVNLQPESSFNLQANVPVLGDANLSPPPVTQVPRDATSLKDNPSLSKNETPCPFILRRGWCKKGEHCDFSRRNMVNNVQLVNSPTNKKARYFAPSCARRVTV